MSLPVNAPSVEPPPVPWWAGNALGRLTTRRYPVRRGRSRSGGGGGGGGSDELLLETGGTDAYLLETGGTDAYLIE